jgi:hypothetical protein
MGIRVEWFDPAKQSIYFCFEGTYTWDELFASIEEATGLLNTVDYRVNMVVDVTQSMHIPPVSPTKLQKVAQAATMNPDLIRTGIVIGAIPYMQTMFDLYRRLYPRSAAKFQFVRTMTEARMLLEKDEQVQDL